MFTSSQTSQVSVLTQLITPAIFRLMSETDGSYRCERDLHHHFTACLQAVQPLKLGTRQRIVNTEEPCYACYGSGRKGNLDYFFPKDPGRPCSGIGVELNCDYRDGYSKIVRDIQKLIDPQNGYDEALYFAYGRKREFFEAVKIGIERAHAYFSAMQPDFKLPIGLHLIVVERHGTGHVLHGSAVQTACVPRDLTWIEQRMGANTTFSPELDVNADVAAAQYIDRASAEGLLYSALSQAEIPLSSTTARCVFEATRNGSGHNRCKFGTTPLWANEIKVIGGRVLRSEFIDLVQKLCKSGNAFQKAARASWKL